MSSPFKTRAFRALEKTWRKKLEESGFEDCENEKGHLKVYISSQPALLKKSVRKGLSYDNAVLTEEIRKGSLQEYYYKAGQFLNEHSFNTVMDKVIWTLNCEGVSMRRISRRISETCRPMGKSSVERALNRLDKVMTQHFTRQDGSNCDQNWQAGGHSLHLFNSAQTHLAPQKDQEPVTQACLDDDEAQ